MLSPEELKRYNRHIILPEIGIEGQGKLKRAKVLVIGAGGLGCSALQYLTAAGVGTIGILDFDKVDESNLQRQILYGVDDIGQPKAAVAAASLRRQNPNVQFEVFDLKITSENALELITGFDIVLDGSDNFPTRYLLNDACVILGKPLVFGSIYKFEAQLAVFNYNNGPTYRCLYPEPPLPGAVPNCDEIGVLGVLPGIVGCLQANEVIKIITGIGEPLSGKLMVFDALSTQFSTVNVELVKANSDITELIDYEDFCGSKQEWEINEITAEELYQKINAHEDIQIIDVREKHEYEICNLGGDLIPLATITQSTGRISKNKPVIVHCHRGIRSVKAIQELEETKGYTNLINLKGGIHAWATEVDSEMSTY